MPEKQSPNIHINSSNTILMVRPANFGLNLDTIADNAFQISEQSPQVQKNESIKLNAIKQFDNFVSKLQEQGVDVIVVQDSQQPVKPDAVFPNNWFTANHDGTVILFPMKPQSRRPERQNPVLKQLQKKHFKIKQIIDISMHQSYNQFLQGTGSMILDHQNKIAYACRSERTNQKLFRQVCEKYLKYEPVYFRASDSNNKAYYHTNVMMSVCSDFVVVCLSSIKDEKQKNIVVQSIKNSKKQLIDITEQQVGHFCGNILQVFGKQNKILVMGQQSYLNFTQEQIKTFNKYCNKIVKVPLPTIQKYGGGGARCMMAEIFLPKASTNE